MLSGNLLFKSAESYLCIRRLWWPVDLLFRRNSLIVIYNVSCKITEGPKLGEFACYRTNRGKGGTSTRTSEAIVLTTYFFLGWILPMLRVIQGFDRHWGTLFSEQNDSIGCYSNKPLQTFPGGSIPRRKGYLSGNPHLLRFTRPEKFPLYVSMILEIGQLNSCW